MEKNDDDKKIEEKEIVENLIIDDDFSLFDIFNLMVLMVIIKQKKLKKKKIDEISQWIHILSRCEKHFTNKKLWSVPTRISRRPRTNLYIIHKRVQSLIFANTLQWRSTEQQQQQKTTQNKEALMEAFKI